MSESPPKRMTRARARAAEITKEPPKTVNLSAATKKVPWTTTKRKAPADEPDNDNATLAAGTPPVASVKRKPTNSAKGRARKAVTQKTEGIESEAKLAGEPKMEDAAVHPGRVTRGRPKRSTIVEPERSIDADLPAGKKITRARAAASANQAPNKKKVTFQEDERADKENLFPMGDDARRPDSSDGKTSAKPEGLRARPLRRPAPTRSLRRGQNSEPDAKQDPEPSRPLSPKRTPALLTASTMGLKESELSVQSNQFKPLSMSPSKIPGFTPLKRDMPMLDLAASTGLRQDLDHRPSPSKIMSSSVLGSPARRPPASPFKDSLRESPKRNNLGDSLLSQPVLRTPASPSKSVVAPRCSPFKASLLQSPARRPAVSPQKPTTVTSPVRDGAIFSLRGSPGSSGRSPVFRIPVYSPDRVAAKSPRQHLPAAHTEADESPVRGKGIEQLNRNTSNKARYSSGSSPIPRGDSPTQDPKQGRPSLAGISSSLRKVATTPSRIPTPTWSPSIRIAEDATNEIASPPLSPKSTSFDPEETLNVLSRSTTPPGPPPGSALPASMAGTDTIDQSLQDARPEEELRQTKSVHTPVQLGQYRISSKDFGYSVASSSSPTPTVSRFSLARQAAQGNLFEDADSDQDAPSPIQHAQLVSMTPLIKKLGDWRASSPNKDKDAIHGPPTCDILSPTLENPALGAVSSDLQVSPAKSNFFDDEMSVRGHHPVVQDEVVQEIEDEIVDMIQTDPSEASQEYGDENAVPIDPLLLAADQRTQGPLTTCTPAKVFSQVPRTVHTVSKVPLRAAADDSPNCFALKRSNSVSGSLSSRNDLATPTVPRSKSLASISPTKTAMSKRESLAANYPTPSGFVSTPQRSARSVGYTTPYTPGLTPRRPINPDTLKGAVVHVDVHTSEGSDASSIFVELLVQMGARCVKQWTWNPHSDEQTMCVEQSAEANTDGSAVTTPASKVGVTHIVFKDGSKRTLEKVRETKGVVLCVGVAWVLDCERENRWLDETEYAIDTSCVPRGGHNRRKSMEPRALQTLMYRTPPASNLSANYLGSPPTFSPATEFLTFSSPARRESTLFAMVPATPEQQANDESFTCDSSPDTPYYLHPAQIVQRTCPAKPRAQTPRRPGEFLFPIAGPIEDLPDDRVRQRLMIARRKSLQFAPKIASPLRSWEHGRDDE